MVKIDGKHYDNSYSIGHAYILYLVSRTSSNPVLPGQRVAHLIPYPHDTAGAGQHARSMMALLTRGADRPPC